MRSLIYPFLIFIGLSLSYGCATASSETYLRPRVVRLSGAEGMCSGEQIVAPSGTNYILTAAHCRPFERNGSILVTTEDGQILQRRVIAEDQNSDLLLLEGLPGVEGISIATHDHPGQHVRTLTHGHNLDTYLTEGYLIQNQEVHIPINVINTPEDAAKCQSMAKFMQVPSIWGSLCALNVVETITSAMIVPGSSGGMVVSDSGELVGVVSAGAPPFGALVTLYDINKFLAAY